MPSKDNSVASCAQQILTQVKTVVVGKDPVLLWVLAAILARGHILLEDIPGVGKKTAERIILELKGTLDAGMESLFSQGAAESASSAAAQGATEALLSMGFTSAEAEVALKGAPEGAGEGALLQYALKRLGSR